MFLQIALFLLLSVVSWAQCPPQDSWECNPPENSVMVINVGDGAYRNMAIAPSSFSIIGDVIITYTAQGGACYFDGASGCIGITDVISAVPFSISMWALSYDLSEDPYQFLIYMGAPDEYALGSAEYRNDLGYNIDDWWEWTGIYPWDETWHHFVSVFNESNNFKLYFDGNMVVDANYEELYLGCEKFIGGHYLGESLGAIFLGYITDIIVCNKAVSANEVAELYQRGKADGK